MTDGLEPGSGRRPIGWRKGRAVFATMSRWVAAGLLVTAACFVSSCAGGSDPPGESTGASASGPDLATLTQQADFYMDVASPEAWAAWGSSVVVATVVDEVPEAGEAAASDGASSTADLSLRRMTLRVDEVVWSRPDAVTKVSAPGTLAVRSHGFSQDGRSAVVLDGTTRMEVGATYLVVLVDDVAADGTQTLEYLDGTAQPLDASGTTIAQRAASGLGGDTVDAVVTRIEQAPADPTVPGPEPGTSFDERIIAFVSGSTG